MIAVSPLLRSTPAGSHQPPSPARFRSQVDPNPEARAAIAKLIQDAAEDTPTASALPPPPPPREFGSLKEALAADPDSELFAAVVSVALRCNTVSNIPPPRCNREPPLIPAGVRQQARCPHGQNGVQWLLLVFIWFSAWTNTWCWTQL